MKLNSKPSKKKNKKCIIDGITFDSQVEGRYYEYLKHEKKAGRILKFELQPTVTLQNKFTHSSGEKLRAITYRLDFHVTYSNGVNAYIDVKGQATTDALIKRKMFMSKNPFTTIKWVSESKKWGDKDGWIDFFELKRVRVKNKKNKKAPGSK